MFRFETVVIAVSILLGPHGMAQSDLGSRFSGDSCSLEYQTTVKDVCGLESTPEAKKDCALKAKQDLNTCRVKYGSGSQANCDQESRSAFEKALGEFQSACRKAGISSEGPAGNVACSAKLRECADRPVGNSSAAMGGLKDIEGSREQFAQCRHLARQDQDKIDKQIEKARERKRDLDKRMPDLEQKVADSQNDSEKEIKEIRKEARDAAAEYAKQMKEAKRNLEAAQKEIGQQIAAVQQQMDEMDRQMVQLELSKGDADIKFQEAVTQVDLSCHATAAQQVAKLQEERLALERTRGFNRGGFANMMKQVGVSDRESWQRLAKKYYDWCRDSKPVKDQKRSFVKVRDSALKATEAAIADVEKKKSGLRGELAKLSDTNGCGFATANADGSTNETEMCKALRQAYEDQQQVAQDYQTKQEGFMEAQQAAAWAGSRKQMAAAKALYQAQNELAEETMRLRNLEQFYALKTEYGGGSSVEARDISDAHDKYGAFIGTAQTRMSCCEQRQKLGDSDIMSSRSCQVADRFLEQIGEKLSSTPLGGDEPLVRPESTERETPRPPEAERGRPGRDGLPGQNGQTPPQKPSTTTPQNAAQ